METEFTKNYAIVKSIDEIPVFEGDDFAEQDFFDEIENVEKEQQN